MLSSLPLRALLALKILVLALLWLFGSTGTAVVSAPGALARVMAHNGDDGDLFGGAVALSRDGRTLVVGADLEASHSASDSRDNSLPGAGAVYVYERQGQGWKETAYLKAPQPVAGGGFGFAVALSDDGQTLAVGAPFEPGEGMGVVHVFGLSDGRWLPEVRLHAPEGVARFGVGLDLSDDGSGLAVASSDRPGRTQAHLFTRLAGRWSSGQRVDHESAGDGSAVPRLALSGNGQRLALSHSAADTVGFFEAGTTGWARAGTWAVAPEAGAASGVQVLAFSTDGRTLALSGPQGRIDVLVDAPEAGWGLQVHLRAEPQTPALGHRLALSADGDVLVVNAAGDAPHVYRFQRHAHQWHALPTLSFTGDPQSPFGSALALSADGRLLAVGSRFENPGRRWPWSARPTRGEGAVHLFAPA